MEHEMVCLSCKQKVTNKTGTVTFACPSCKAKIVRCGNCRAIAAKYSCKECNFIGPN